jgi:hypothetical protein
VEVLEAAVLAAFRAAAAALVVAVLPGAGNEE